MTPRSGAAPVRDRPRNRATRPADEARGELDPSEGLRPDGGSANSRLAPPWAIGLGGVLTPLGDHRAVWLRSPGPRVDARNVEEQRQRPATAQRHLGGPLLLTICLA